MSCLCQAVGIKQRVTVAKKHQSNIFITLWFEEEDTNTKSRSTVSVQLALGASGTAVGMICIQTSAFIADH